MSDDVEARFAAVRVSFGTVHKILCEGDQSTDFENILRASQPSQTGAGLQKKPRSHARESNPLRETINVSLERFASR